jgi:hypothetical protein
MDGAYLFLILIIDSGLNIEPMITEEKVVTSSPLELLESACDSLSSISWVADNTLHLRPPWKKHHGGAIRNVIVKMKEFRQTIDSLVGIILTNIKLVKMTDDELHYIWLPHLKRLGFDGDSIETLAYKHKFGPPQEQK